MTATATGTELKEAGQAVSLDATTEDQIEAFMAVVRDVPVGKTVSVNDVRSALDEAGVPDRSRGGLFAKAVKAGLLQPTAVFAAGRWVPLRIPSTGPSAHAATVRVYERIAERPLW